MTKAAEIIPPVARELIKAELTPERFLRYTNNGDNLVYLVDYLNAPHLVREIGRLRELTFRAAGGGTGKAWDLDENDTSENCYQQMITWNEADEEIVAGYRLICCKDALGPDGTLR